MPSINTAMPTYRFLPTVAFLDHVIEQNDGSPAITQWTQIQ